MLNLFVKNVTVNGQMKLDPFQCHIWKWNWIHLTATSGNETGSISLSGNEKADKLAKKGERQLHPDTDIAYEAPVEPSRDQSIYPIRTIKHISISNYVNKKHNSHSI